MTDDISKLIEQDMNQLLSLEKKTADDSLEIDLTENETKNTNPIKTFVHKLPDVSFEDKSLLKKYLQKNQYIDLFDKIAGIIYGCALGDCVGVPNENKTAIDLQNTQRPPITDIPTADFRGVRAGDWSDDTDEMILLMEVLTERKLLFEVPLFAKKLARWLKHGFEDLGDPNGVGLDVYTRMLLSSVDYEASPIAEARKLHAERAHSTPINSCLPRVGIISFLPQWMKYTISQCVMTHPDARCIYTSWMLAAICRCLMKGIIPTDEYLFDPVKTFLKSEFLQKEFETFRLIFTGPTKSILTRLNVGDESDKQHIYKTFGSAFYMLRLIRESIEYKSPLDYKTVILEIVNSGGDTDTNAAVAGQVYGSYYGYKALPVDWLNKLINKDWLDKKITKLFDLISL